MLRKRGGRCSRTSKIRYYIRYFRILAFFALLQFFRSSEPLEGLDTLDVLFNMNEPVHIRYPGFRHRFVRLFVIFCVHLCSRSTCRHVDPFKRCLIHLRVFLFIERICSFFSNSRASESRWLRLWLQPTSPPRRSLLSRGGPLLRLLPHLPNAGLFPPIDLLFAITANNPATSPRNALPAQPQLQLRQQSLPSRSNERVFFLLLLSFLL